MVQISVEIPDELERKARMLKIELSLLLAQIVKEKFEELEMLERFKRSVARSKLTEKDVEELSDKVKTAVWEHHKNVK